MEAHFLLAGPDDPIAERESFQGTLHESWDQMTSRQCVNNLEWTLNLTRYMTWLVDQRAAHVNMWLKSNIQQFQARNSSIEKLCRTFDSTVIDLQASIQLCWSQCSLCNLFCIQSHLHEGNHNCLINHECIHNCNFCERDLLTVKNCGQM